MTFIYQRSNDVCGYYGNALKETYMRHPGHAAHGLYAMCCLT